MDTQIEQAYTRLKELEVELSKQDILQDQKQYKKLAQEHGYVRKIVQAHSKIETLHKELSQNKQLLKEENDPEMTSMIQETIENDQKIVEKLENTLKTLLVPPDPNDSKTTILELRAGTGGTEAALFVADCVRMYQNFAQHKKWQVETLSTSPADLGGFKEYLMAISGTDVHRYLQYEGGTHRVQRIPETETQGRIHTSAMTVAVLMEADEDDNIQIEEKELRIDTYRASGAGGQHVNTTDSAVRITHLPTNIVAHCQDERSQHKNKEKAMRLLKAKLAEEKRKQAAQELSDLRSSQIGSGDRSERIRTYNFPQNRLTEHRIPLTKYNLNEIMEGDLEEITASLITHFHNQ